MPRKTTPSKSPKVKPKPLVVSQPSVPILPSPLLLVLTSTAVLILALLLAYMNVHKVNEGAPQEQAYRVIPVANENSQQAPQLISKGVFVQDVESGETLFEQNANTPVLPASTTKLATAIAAIKVYNPDQVLTVGKVRVGGNKMGLVSREQITAGNLIRGLLIYSANDAAVVLAQNHPQGRESFIEQMNVVARDAGLTNTHFTNAAGFDQYLHYSTARDLARLALFAYQNPQIAEIVGTKEAEVQSIDGKIKHKLVNTNELLGNVPGVVGIKTGTTSVSGESLVTLINRDNHKVIIVLMGSINRFEETKALIDWVFGNFSWKKEVNSAQ